MKITDNFIQIPSTLTFTSRTSNEFEGKYNQHSKVFTEISRMENELISKGVGQKIRYLNGYSVAAAKEATFLVEGGPEVNWRESLICNHTQLNNRSRASINISQFLLGVLPSSAIYMTEQTTPLWRWMSGVYKNTIGSEYVNNANLGLELNGIRNEDITKLSFENNTFDFLMSFDVLEHVPNYKKALSEIHRITKDGGKTLLTFPFRAIGTTLTRAIVENDGNIKHIMPPEYHGDPINPENGILCYYHFGHDIIAEMLEIGFKDAYVLWFWSASNGNLGGMQPYVIGIK